MPSSPSGNRSEEFGPLTCFTARASGGKREERIAFLMKSLEETKQAFFKQFGSRETTDDLTFVGGATHHIPHKEVGKITAILKRCDEENRPFQQVLNGYEGLSTNPAQFLKVYGPFKHVDTTFTAYVDRPRKFVHCKMIDLVQLIEESTLADEKEAENVMDGNSQPLQASESSARQFLEIFGLLATKRYNLSAAQSSMNKYSYHRNTPPTIYNCTKEGCGDSFTNKRKFRVHEAGCQKPLPELRVEDIGAPCCEGSR